jgi:hypothetical protein
VVDGGHKVTQSNPVIETIDRCDSARMLRFTPLPPPPENRHEPGFAAHR